MGNAIQLFDEVALTQDLPACGLRREQVGTIVEELAPDAYQVEFSDDQGRTYALLALCGEQLMVLRFSADQQAA